MNTINTIQLSPRHTERPSHRGQSANLSIPARLWRFYCALAAKRRSRLVLGDLSDHQLKDIGVSEAEARREAAVPFWR
ncbi:MULTISPECIES: DUF1127 domain-containing protein [Sinorhizobium]|uniref:YjiS-like domain-containing protein n=3 Tax=Sinorhizobium TaxID=28105 RepID=A0A2S3YP25_9HYPH|nr:MULTISPECIES: DUF1127 domain-containing protein [Sinorhizobium]AUX76549.1 hypothetical protein NXT3_CH01984 [Sinorhizobium fredii]PDT42778.1 DUF1127 domain-containing protein [Sinorhizobium sp. FG01]PDT54915.1 DUF1127 domain-containing protein [Sinorhizobium sp. NG07B]POH31957.1 hypothetical protein ATY30_11110 [Sinorhizobium americanum]POH32702.1 hypothetical protein ATY31_12385 [Sinorhizobium americanum]